MNKLIPFDQFARETLELVKEHSKDLSPEEQKLFFAGVMDFFMGQPFGEANHPD